MSTDPHIKDRGKEEDWKDGSISSAKWILDKLWTGEKISVLFSVLTHLIYWSRGGVPRFAWSLVFRLLPPFTLFTDCHKCLLIALTFLSYECIGLRYGIVQWKYTLVPTPPEPGVCILMMLFCVPSTLLTCSGLFANKASVMFCVNLDLTLLHFYTFCLLTHDDDLLFWTMEDELYLVHLCFCTRAMLCF